MFDSAEGLVSPTRVAHARGSSHSAALSGASATKSRPASLDRRSFSKLSARDRELVEAIRTGNAAAASSLHAALRPSIDSALYRVLRSRPPEFEDLVQVTYERVIRTIAGGKFKGKSQLKTWASSIAVHVALDHLRRHRQEQRLFQAMDVTAIDLCAQNRLPERQLEARSEVRQVLGVLRRMKPRRASVLVLHDVFGFSMPEVAGRLGMNLAGAESALVRARQEFSRRFTPMSCPSYQVW